MKLYLFRGLDNEIVPKDVTHVVVAKNVTTIKDYIFYGSEQLISIIMDDNVRIIGRFAFGGCISLKFVRLSIKLSCIRSCAFNSCHSLEALFLSSTLRSIASEVFGFCQSLRVMILPLDTINENADNSLSQSESLDSVAVAATAAFPRVMDENRPHQVNEWFILRMDNLPFHRICYETSVTTETIVDYIEMNGVESALQKDTINRMTPLHMLAMNPHAPADAIAALFDINMEAIFCLDNQKKTPLDYAREYNVGGMIGLTNALSNHRDSNGVDKVGESVGMSKKRKIEDAFLR